MEGSTIAEKSATSLTIGGQSLFTRKALALYVLASLAGILLAWKIAYAVAEPTEREKVFIHIGSLKAQQEELHEEAEVWRQEIIDREHWIEQNSAEWNRKNMEINAAWEELFL